MALIDEPSYVWRGASELARKIRREWILSFLKTQGLPIKIGVAYERMKLMYGSDFTMSYKTWQRVVDRLAKRGDIDIEKHLNSLYGQGNTTLIVQVYPF